MRGRFVTLAVAGALAGLVGSAAAHTPGPAPGRIVEGPLGPGEIVSLFGLTSGPDGAMWFTDLGCIGFGQCAIGRLDSGQTITLYRRGLPSTALPYAITSAGGDLWFTDEGRRPAIGRVTPDGRITEYRRGLAAGSQPFEIVPGAGGTVWFTDQGRRPAIGRISRSGIITEFRAGLGRGSMPFGIAAGPAGSIWFTDRGCAGVGRCAIGTIAAGGRIRELHRGLPGGARPLGIAAGPGGDMWFADAAGALGRVTPAGRVSERRRGLAPGSSPTAVAPGPDGSLWFSDEGSTAAIGRVTPTGRVTEYTRGLDPGSQPAILAAAPDGRMLFSDEGSQAALGLVTTGARPALAAAPLITGPHVTGATLTCMSARWRTWDGGAPSALRLPTGGTQWFVDGAPIAGGHGSRLVVPAGRAGRRITCRQTVTYPPPTSVTAAAASAPVTIG